MEKIEINKIKNNPNNPRILKDEKFKKLVKSIQEFPEMLELRPIVVNNDMIVLWGNMRLKACKEAWLKEIPIIKASELTEEQQREFIIKDNVGYGEWDWEMLANEWESEELEDWGLDLPWFEEFNKNEYESSNLFDKFIIPPFSVLDTRQWYWQERKKFWKNIINDNWESREKAMWDNLVLDNNQSKYKESTLNFAPNISILDPVLSELVNKWFWLEGGNTFDCFAGDTVFWFVSSFLWNNFTWIEIRKQQADLNNQRIEKFENSKYICDDWQNILKHLDYNSQDLLFSCPPYFDLEVYSDLENDASNQKNYEDFIKILDNAFTDAIKCLKNDRFAVITIWDLRDKKGFYYWFVDDIKNIFKKNWVLLYNEMILVENVWTLAMRVNKYMKNRKIWKCHQNVLVFYKWDTKNIKNIYPLIEFENESWDVQF